MRVGKSLALLKFRFDLGISFMVLLNMSLLVVTAAPQISQFAHLDTKTIILLGIPSALFGTWLFGYVLDKIGFQHGINENLNERNPQIQEILKQLDDIKREVGSWKNKN